VSPLAVSLSPTECKSLLSQLLGEKKFAVYWDAVSKFLRFKTTKKELDSGLLQLLERDRVKVGLHNAFVNALLRAAHESTAPVAVMRLKRPLPPQAPVDEAPRVTTKGFSTRDIQRRRRDVQFSLDAPHLRALKRRMLNTARQMRLRDVANDAVELLYRAAEHRLTELLRRSRTAPQRLAPAVPSIHVRAVPLALPTGAALKASLSSSSSSAAASAAAEGVVSGSDFFASLRGGGEFAVGGLVLPDKGPIDAAWLHASVLIDAEHEWLPPARPITRMRSNVTVRCAGVVAPLDLVRALRLHAPLLAEDAVVNRERAGLGVVKQ
jgi:hypothetical protein